tara:strand:- start:125 stop:382 length:258 start_codon:yes stop_codon:yes gene_type:complete
MLPSGRSGSRDVMYSLASFARIPQLGVSCSSSSPAAVDDTSLILIIDGVNVGGPLLLLLLLASPLANIAVALRSGAMTSAEFAMS